MGKNESKILTEALTLPPESRAKLAEQLLASLDGPDQATIDAAWAQEVEKSIDAFDGGKTSAHPIDLRAPVS